MYYKTEGGIRVKCIVIEYCLSCPFVQVDHNNRDYFCDPYTTGYKLIGKIEDILTIEEVPEWCPLEDISSVKDRIKLGEVY